MYLRSNKGLVVESVCWVFKNLVLFHKAYKLTNNLSVSHIDKADCLWITVKGSIYSQSIVINTGSPLVFVSY